MTDQALLSAALALKGLDRAGWKRVGIERPESVAAHSWGVTLAALLRCPPGLNREKVLIMAILHDLAEATVGDITPHDGVSREEKQRREEEAIRLLLGDHPELLALWEEAEQRQSPEAQFVKEMDLLDMGLTARHYATMADTSEFFASAGAALSRL
ncbi:MAG TPA: HD domain-containing protein [Myxococcota bacterium]|nr:HD domain-containing protein [Myxococcota bacterium]HND29194.1 HD domain-containing protein [Myxococcota bacterium]